MIINEMYEKMGIKPETIDKSNEICDLLKERFDNLNNDSYQRFWELLQEEYYGL